MTRRRAGSIAGRVRANEGRPRSRTRRRAGAAVRKACPGTFVLAAVAAAVAIAGCGSQSKTFTLSPAPPVKAARSSATSTTTQTKSSSETSTAAETTTATETEASQTATEQVTSSRTSSAPAFVEQEGASHEGALGGAVAIVEREGYVPTSPAEYHGSQTLRVLTANRSGSSGGNGEQAFFFVDGRYIGTDASQPSASISVVSQSDTEVVLGYGLYDSGEAKVGEAEVHFQLDNGKLTALDSIPPVRPSGRTPGRL
jgi:LppP/LprE lipoprotein